MKPVLTESIDKIKDLDIFELKLLLIEIESLLDSKKEDLDIEIKKRNVMVEQNWADLLGLKY